MSMPPAECHHEAYTISTDKQKLDLSCIHEFLSRDSYWAKGRPLETVRRSIENSLAFGVYEGDRQIGFARVVTDYATFAWLADVFILRPWRGKGLSKWLVSTILDHPDLQSLRRWMLATNDAHELYRRFGFTEIPDPKRIMGILRDPGLRTGS